MARKETNQSAAEPAAAPGDFEQAIRRLEDIVHCLEEGDVGLNEALERYGEGVKLLRQSYDLLERAERRIELLSGVDAEGNPITRPVEDHATFGREEKTPAPQGQTLAREEQSPRRGRRRLAEGGSPSQEPDTSRPNGGDIDMDAPKGLF